MKMMFCNKNRVVWVDMGGVVSVAANEPNIFNHRFT
jgi:hypothetical protein